MGDAVTLEELLSAPPRTRAHVEYGPAWVKDEEGWWRDPTYAGHSTNSAALLARGVRRVVKPKPTEIGAVY